MALEGAHLDLFFGSHQTSLPANPAPTLCRHYSGSDFVACEI
jgi:hypothetical protein